MFKIHTEIVENLKENYLSSFYVPQGPLLCIRFTADFLWHFEMKMDLNKMLICLLLKVMNNDCEIILMKYISKFISQKGIPHTTLKLCFYFVKNLKYTSLGQFAFDN